MEGGTYGQTSQNIVTCDQITLFFCLMHQMVIQSCAEWELIICKFPAILYYALVLPSTNGRLDYR
jgi:hypothetical protein